MAWLVGGLVLLASTAHAVVPRGTGTGARSPRIPAEHLTALPAAGVTKPLRAYRQIRFAPRPSAAWQQLVARGGTWQAAWDTATGVPSRIWGSGLPAPGASASAAVAEAFARRFLADHLALLAPGAAPGDFELVSNHDDGDQRSLGFVQRAGGRRVVGGQVSFRFKRDRLFVIGSEALPHVAYAQPRARLARAALARRATDLLRRELDLAEAPVTLPAPGDEVVLPLVGDDAVLGYRLAATAMIDGGVDGRYLAYLDPATGDVLAVHQQNSYATGTVRYRGVERYPGRGRVDLPASRTNVRVGGTPRQTSAAGAVTWTPDVAQTITTSVAGALVTIVNKADEGALASAELTLAPGGQAVWDASAVAEDDAQIVTFLGAAIAKDYARTFDPQLPKYDEPLVANVNIAQACNAFFDGKTINFFQSSMNCENTGLIADVIYHEYGHALHALQIIQGVGAFDGAMSEGAADFLSASITGDPAMGRGFRKNDDPLRHLDPPNEERRWPEHIAEIHQTGLIYGGTFWDLRKALIAALGEEAGIAVVNKLYLATMRRAVSIPTSMIEALAADDDDGDLSNGTPHECIIREAYGRHGLRTATGAVRAPGALDENALATLVYIDVTGLSERCASDEVTEVTLSWRPSQTNQPLAGVAQMKPLAFGRYYAQLPLALDEVVYYVARVRFRDGTILTLADNYADPYYATYQGTTIPLYCTDFETADPFAEGWTQGGTEGVVPQWEWGAPVGVGTDPGAAYSGTRVLGQNLGGAYKHNARSWVRLPRIDVGAWSDVRLQYRRWLAVEDSHFDKARVTVNGERAWFNFTADRGDSSATHHIDREWRFHDVSVSGYGHGHTLDIAFDLHTDAGLALGGWTLDDVCVVANVKSVCGDGVKSLTEQCDEGAANSNEPNAACRTWCKRAACGDGIVDDGEQCDAGGGGDDACTADCQEVELPTLGGCCSSSRGAAGSIVLGVLVAFAGLGRAGRRRLTGRGR